VTTLYEWAGGDDAFARLSLAADDAGLPDDPEFRSALVAYLEWGTRLALHNSQPGAVAPHAPVPRWGWGEAPPYVP
jgi:hemoglobin